MNILNIIMALFNLVPKKYKDAALQALAVTNWLKSAIKGLQETGVLDKTNVDEKILQWLDRIPVEFKIGMQGVAFDEYLAKQDTGSLNGILGHIGALITRDLHGNSKTSPAKTFFEIIYAKNKQA